MPAMGAAAVGGLGSALGTSGGMAAMGSLGSGLLGYFGANKAANQQAEGQRQALAMYKPYADAGTGALTTLAKLYGTGPNGQPAMNPAALANFRNTPGYNFTMGEGLRATDFGDSARGSLLSSNNMRNRTDYASGLADKTFMGNYVQPLLQMANVGAQGVQGAAGALSGAANAQAGGTVGGINALGGALAGAGNNYMLYNALNKSAYGGGGGMGGGGGYGGLGSGGAP